MQVGGVKVHIPKVEIFSTASPQLCLVGMQILRQTLSPLFQSHQLSPYDLERVGVAPFYELSPEISHLHLNPHGHGLVPKEKPDFFYGRCDHKVNLNLSV